MTKERKGEASSTEKVPLGQVLFDDMFLLLALGLGLPLVSYIVWALVDLSKVPPMSP